MIGVDLGMLTILKTFASMRSYIRYYTIKSGFSKRGQNNVTRRGRRKEWRNKLHKATNYNEFLEIEIQEPVPVRELPKPEKKKITWNIFQSPPNKHGNVLSLAQALERSNSKFDLKRSQSCADLDHSTIRIPPSPAKRSTSMDDIFTQMNDFDDIEKELGRMGPMLIKSTQQLREARLQSASAMKGFPVGRISEENLLHYNNESNVPLQDNATSTLQSLLQGVLKRNHLSVDDILIRDAKSIMECGRHLLSSKSRDVIYGFNEEVERCLIWLAESKVSSDHANGTDSSRDSSPSRSIDQELSDRLNVMRKMKHNMGRSALMLSGGGAQAMYHLGTIKALCESRIYDDIQVISGTSGGSITAAVCAIKTREEILRDACVPTVSTDYMLTGEMARQNIRWFPKLVEMGAYWLKHKLLVDSEEFKRCCEFYFGDVTFEEAFERTGKHVCITVSASRAESGGAQRLLLNHISTPRVTLASAVAASCALPGVMAPAKLRTKNSAGVQELFEVDGVEWIDGSVQADLPFKRISALFNVSNYVVAQTNFHVLPFLHKAHHPNMKSIYWSLFQICEMDIRSRALNLSRLNLFPKIFGHDISKVFEQKYHGHLTLVPHFTTMQVFGLKSLSNPTVEDMKIYLQNGQAAAWPYLSVMKEMLRFESTIDKCISKLIERRNQVTPVKSEWDDVESITSTTTHSMLGTRREVELLRSKVKSLEDENSMLREQLKTFERRQL
jgi:predicted acylesterase/phospholipase RssA